jgi:hypothetical protein
VASVKNPFNPSFGYHSNSYVELDDVVEETTALHDDIDSYYRSLLITGLRGTGKSSLLARIKEGLEQVATDEKRVITLDFSARRKVSSVDTLLDKIEYTVRNQNMISKTISKLNQLSGGVKLSTAGVGLDASLKTTTDEPYPYRTEAIKLQAALDKLQPKQNLVLVEIDEGQNDPEGIAAIISAYQTLQASGYLIVLVIAGLPPLVDALFTNEDISFYRRVNHLAFNLSNNPEITDGLDYEFETRQKFTDLFENEGFRFTDPATEIIDALPFDYLFFYQTLGYSLWRHLAREEHVEITEDDVQLSLVEAKKLLFNKGYKQMWKELAPGQQEYMAAIGTVADLDGVAHSGEAARLNGKSSTQYSSVRDRMIQMGYTEKQSERTVRFALPYFAEFAASQRRTNKVD